MIVRIMQCLLELYGLTDILSAPDRIICVSAFGMERIKEVYNTSLPYSKFYACNMHDTCTEQEVTCM